MHRKLIAAMLAASSSGGGGGGGGGGAASTALDPLTIGSHLTLSGGNLIATSTGSGDTGAIGDTGHTSGKWYFEFDFDASATGADTGAGISMTPPNYSGLGGTSTNGAMAYKNGNMWAVGSFTGLGIGTLTGNTLCVAVDLDNMMIWFRKNAGGSTWNARGPTADPATNTLGWSLSGLTGSIVPALTLTGSGEKITARFTGPFVGAVPSGFN